MNDTLLKLPTVCATVELSSPQIYRLMDQGRFPKPVHIGRSARWSRDDVQAWIQQQKDQRDQAVSA